MLPPTTPELDACGIGFVADAQGRSSRSIVAAALGGLACVKHRGAVAADARTADGSGLLVPIPPALFGDRAPVLHAGEAPQGGGHDGTGRSALGIGDEADATGVELAGRGGEHGACLLRDDLPAVAGTGDQSTSPRSR